MSTNTYRERRNIRIIRYSLFACIVLSLFVSLSALAAPAQYVPLVGIPQLESGTGKGLPTYLNAVYVMLIAIGGIIAVVKIIIVGVKYSFDDIVTHKSEAKNDIYGVLKGLAILLIPFIVLNTIYPNLTNLDILKSATPITFTPYSAPPGGPGSGETLPQLNQRIVDACSPAPGKQVNVAACGSVATPEDKQAATSCNGYYDLNVNTCFSKDASFTYDTSLAGNFRSGTKDGWDTLCGGADKVNQVESGNTITYSCNTGTGATTIVPDCQRALNGECLATNFASFCSASGGNTYAGTNSKTCCDWGTVQKQDDTCQ